MRILQVIHDFIDTNPLGGTELYSYYLTKELQKSHEVGVFYYELGDHFSWRQGEVHGIRTFVVKIPVWSVRWSYFNYRHERVNEGFRAVLSLFTPDLVHFQHLLFSSMDFPSIAKPLGLSTVHTLHDYYLMCPKFRLFDYRGNRCDEVDRIKCFICCLEPQSKKNLARKLATERTPSARLLFELLWRRDRMIKKKVFRDIDMFISPSQFLRRKFIQYGLPEEKILYSDNGMNLEINEGDDLGKNGGPLMTFGYLGAHQAEKGLPLLIDAFNEIENARLFIYGSSGENDFRNLVRNPNIIFKGAIGDGQKKEAFSGMDALIVPSTWFENSPLTIHEAFIFKRPVITSNIGGMAELVKDGVAGWQFEAGSVSSLREKIRLCMENPGIVRMAGERAPKVKSIRENAEEMEKLYSGLVQKGRPFPGKR